ncbi:MAG TPA: biotin carboxylase N-terminal domain-containing protein, partial [Gammaproteobacteria bacterium]|nr:biotin carboxylase N-terminal domain-containing protein [Gammaproteobacteria bacterium]
MIRKILIANRGEIACRIIQTCKKLGIHSVAVYSDIDRNARHVQLADEAYYLGSNPAQQSYLNIEKILSVAKRAKAQAIHPGYGFLSEKASFAKACELAGLIFIGPKADVIEAMGNKDRAKTLMENAKVPIMPGYHGSDQTLNRLLEEAKSLLPLMIKARAGGGGKGMRIVHHVDDILDSLESAKRESAKNFHDEALVLEKYLPQARHIEVQVFGDNFGNHVHLFERDCSLQRRHQKIIEEAPALNMGQEIKEALYQTALNACKAIQYTNAGTFEFLFTPFDNKFYFLEMNTRLQVEHPVTEMITGLDLVEWQILIANNEPLPLKQEEIACFGHAIEARIYAEDASNHFFPATGEVKALILPNDREVRLELGLLKNDKIDIHYDPILAKIVAYEKDRTKAIQKLSRTLQQTEIIGV